MPHTVRKPPSAARPLHGAGRSLARAGARVRANQLRLRTIERLSLRAKLVGIAALGILFVVAVGAVAVTGLRTLDAAGTEASTFADAQRLHATALQTLSMLRTDVLAARLGGGGDAPTLAAGSQAIASDTASLHGLLADLGALDLDEPALARQAALFAQSATAAAGSARSAADGDATAFAAFTTDLAASRATAERLQASLRSEVDATAREARSARATARQRILLAAGLAVLVLLAGAHLLSMSIIRALRRIGEAAAAVAGGHLSARARVTSSDEIGLVGQAFDDVADSLTTLLIQMESDSKRADFGRQLGEAMEMVDAEEDVRRVVEQAFVQVDPELPMELLLADSSRAHLERAAESPTAGGAGCTVVSPYSCVAVRKGVATTFETSDALNACAKLRGRPGGACSAVCVPISFMGRSLGVLHATGPAGIPPAPEVSRQLVTLSRHTGMRIGTVRAFAKTELQASTDGLTGLLNRRTLENRIRELLQGNRPFALAMVDLDRFKQLNDTYGHEAGDRALRLFAQVLRETVRGDDIAGRLGGEEFVIVLPENDTTSATPVLERVRARLAESVAQGGGPAFTASFGVTDTSCAAELEGLLRIADAGLLRAKSEGRDRIVVGTGADAAALLAKAA